MQRHPFHRPTALAAAAALVLALAAPPAAALPLELAPRAWGSLWQTAVQVLAAAGWGPSDGAAASSAPAAKNGPELDPLGSPAAGQGEGEVTDQNGPQWDPLG